MRLTLRAAKNAFKFDPIEFSRTHGRVTFSLQQQKVTKKCRPAALTLNKNH
jgi:hypothetical protein